MVTTVNHIKNTLGLDVAFPESVQSRDNILKNTNLTDAQLTTLSPGAYLQPIYDVVTGFDNRNGHDLSRIEMIKVDSNVKNYDNSPSLQQK